MEEAAAVFGVSDQTIRRQIKAGKISAVKFGNTVRIPTAPLWPQVYGVDWEPPRGAVTPETAPEPPKPLPQARDTRRAS